VNVTRVDVAISPHRQEYVAECYDEDKIIPLQLYGALTPVTQSKGWAFAVADIDRKLTLAP